MPVGMAVTIKDNEQHNHNIQMTNQLAKHVINPIPNPIKQHERQHEGKNLV